MTPLELLERLPKILAEVEHAKGQKLTNVNIGEIIIAVGEAIRDGDIDRVAVMGFAAHDPNCTSPPPPKKAARSDVLCCQ